MAERLHNKDSEKLIQKLHGLSALFFLYQTAPHKYQEQIANIQADLMTTIDGLSLARGEELIIPALGPLLLSSIRSLAPENSPLADYLSLLLQLEPEGQLKTIEELVSSFDHILVLSGKKASGKGTISEILREEYCIPGMPTSDWLRGIAQTRNLTEPFNPVMLRDLADGLRGEFGGDVLVWLTLQEFNHKGVRNLVFDGLRSEVELQYLRGRPNVSLIWVEAPDDLRLARVLDRNRPGDPTTISQLLEVDQRSFPKAEKLRSHCNITIVNEGNDINTLKQGVSDLMNRLNISPLKAIVNGPPNR